MRQSVIELREFYASPLGRAARRMVSRQLTEAWGVAGGMDVLALGYATPFVDAMAAQARRVVAGMPSGQGVETWPIGERNRACLADEAALPLANALFDRILAVHALEECDNAQAVLSEICRVLAPTGRAILVVAARHGLWADDETSPFGHGRPFSRRQLERLVRAVGLEPISWTRALYCPPVRWLARWSNGFEQIGAWLWPPFAGLILMEVMKENVVASPLAHRALQRVRAAPVLRPAGLVGTRDAQVVAKPQQPL